MKGGVTAATVLAALCFGFAAPARADRYGGMTQDLLYRVRPPLEALVWFWHAAFAVLLVAILFLVAWAWRRNDYRRLAVFGTMFAVVAGVWWFGPRYLEVVLFEASVLPGGGRWQR